MNHNVNQRTRKPPSSGTSAPYGQSCVECSQHKCKCVTRSNDSRCERCHRFNKECRPSVTVRRRNPKKPSVSKTAQLEEKVDTLLSLLQTGPQASALAHHSSSQTNDEISLHIPSSEGASIASAADDQLPGLPVLTPEATGSEGTSGNSPASLLSNSIEPSPVEAEQYLTTFLTYKAKYFPFVYIPSTVTAQQLRQERPFLWLCVMMIASRSTSQQQGLGSHIQHIIAQEMLLKSEQSVDLLLGLLAFIGWSNYQIHSKPSLSVYTQLSMSLVYDLGLNKPLPKENPQMALCINSHQGPKSPTVRTMEERRAALGCFLITISSFLQKIDALRWTSHLDDCLQVLDERRECLTDMILVQQVRLQLIVEKVAWGEWNNVAMENAEHRKPPLSFYLQTLHSEVQDVRKNLPPQLQYDEVVLAHLYSTELTINEVALSQMPVISNHLNFQRVESLYACVESVKSWFETFFTIPPGAYIGFPFSIFSQLVRCLVTLYKLSTLDDTAWDKNGVQKTANLLLILDQVIENMEQVSVLAGLDNNDSLERDVFFRTANMLRSIRPGWEAILVGSDASKVSALPNLPSADDPSLSEAFPLGHYDNDWLTDFFLAPNY